MISPSSSASAMNNDEDFVADLVFVFVFVLGVVNDHAVEVNRAAQADVTVEAAIFILVYYFVLIDGKWWNGMELPDEYIQWMNRLTD